MNPIAELLNQEGFLKTLFESIPCGVLIVDHDGLIRAVNKGNLGLGGRERRI